MIDTFFTQQSMLKWGIYNTKDDEQKSCGNPYLISVHDLMNNNVKNIEVSRALIARFFYTQYTNGMMTSIQITINKLMEYILPGGIMQVECPQVSILHKYKNGTLVK